ncbi:putative Carboxymuconolactone decarboxylase [Frankia canadensis]|uniref:Putative Carboxymuconolactone decarboxylase n=1 Tax=Frankia canadensis TaxID=1836972 RepID=A0A2I2KHX4_9ACTN|nr:carboxymuconolactone decarboxylase family protein [Frankia canadensis]SNQ45268.1 putative Carboxymuconolactone decarboxylase [Frankia canadensis]SOU52558.1 putative Carboxymuconolactone decarboxylase [Frankia canadensis]
MTRIEPVDPAELFPKVTSRFREGAFSLYGGRLPMLYRVLGNSPTLLSAWLDVAWALRFESTSPRALREIAILLVGHRLEAPYCIGAHVRMAREAGVSAAEIEAVPAWSTSEVFNAQQRAVLGLTEAMLGQHVGGDTLSLVTDLFGPEQTIELVLTIAFYQMVASTTKTLDLAPEG